MIYSLGHSHTSIAGAISLCGLTCRDPKPARPVMPCRWCAMFTRQDRRVVSETPRQRAAKATGAQGGRE